MSRFMGFDIGSLNSCVALPRNNGLDVVENVRGERQTPTCVAFEDHQRIFGGDAVDLNEANVVSTIENFKQFIGRCFSFKELEEIRKDLSYNVRLSQDRHLQITVNYHGKSCMFLPEQVMAMHLVNLKRIASEYCSSDVGEIVMSVPLFYSPEQRRALLDACRIADLKCKLLLNDTTAIATYYTLFNPKIPTEDEPSKHVAFVSVGHMYTQVAICALKRSRIDTLSTSYNSSLGGWHFTKVLYDYFVQTFRDQHGVEIEPGTYYAVRLMNECTKLKERLSMVEGPIPVKIGLANGLILNSSISRTQFDDLSKDLLARISEALDDCLTKSKLQAEDLAAVEMVGGAFRVVAIRNLIKNIFGQEGRTSLNGTEVVAYGCALHAARLSPYQTVTNFPIIEDTDEVAISYLSEEEIRNCIQIEHELAALDERAHKTFFARNQVESTIYRILDEFQDSKIPLTEDERARCVAWLKQKLLTLKNDKLGTEEQYKTVLNKLNEDNQCLYSVANLRRTLLDDLCSLSEAAERHGELLSAFSARFNKLITYPLTCSPYYVDLMEDNAIEAKVSIICAKLPQLSRTVFGSQPFDTVFNNLELKQLVDSLTHNCKTSVRLHSLMLTDLRTSESKIFSACLRNSPDNVVSPVLLHSSPFVAFPQRTRRHRLFWLQDWFWWLYYALYPFSTHTSLTPRLPSPSQGDLDTLLNLVPVPVQNRYIARRLSKKLVSEWHAKDRDNAAIRVVVRRWCTASEQLMQYLESLFSRVVEMSRLCQTSHPTDFHSIYVVTQDLQTALVHAQETNNECVEYLSQLQDESGVEFSEAVIQSWASYHDVIKQALSKITIALHKQQSHWLRSLPMPPAVDWSSCFNKLSDYVSELNTTIKAIVDDAATIKERCQSYICTFAIDFAGNGPFDH